MLRIEIGILESVSSMNTKQCVMLCLERHICFTFFIVLFKETESEKF